MDFLLGVQLHFTINRETTEYQISEINNLLDSVYTRLY